MMEGFCVYNIDAPGQESGAAEYVYCNTLESARDLTHAQDGSQRFVSEARGARRSATRGRKSL